MRCSCSALAVLRSHHAGPCNSTSSLQHGGTSGIGCTLKNVTDQQQAVCNEQQRGNSGREQPGTMHSCNTDVHASAAAARSCNTGAAPAGASGPSREPPHASAPQSNLDCGVPCTPTAQVGLQVGAPVPELPGDKSVGQDSSGCGCSSMPCSTAGNGGVSTHGPSGSTSTSCNSLGSSDSSAPCPATPGSASNTAPGALHNISGGPQVGSASCGGAVPGVSAISAVDAALGEPWSVQGPNAPEP
eukprot:scaffold180401_cov18-Tisochrysis_lutea.AAC.1